MYKLSLIVNVRSWVEVDGITNTEQVIIITIKKKRKCILLILMLGLTSISFAIHDNQWVIISKTLAEMSV